MPTVLVRPEIYTQALTRPGLLDAWHLLSLDAPTVATLWTAFLARATHTPLPATLLPAMFLAVWLLYAADRLLDARLLDARQPVAPNLEPRHLFHHRHARAFRATIGCAALLLIPLVALLPRRDLLLYTALAALLAAWFALIHFLAPGRTLPKELAAAIFFAAAIAIPTHATPLTTTLFGILCALNLFLISHWESPHSAHPTQRAPSIAPLAMGGFTTNVAERSRFLPIAVIFLITSTCIFIPTHPGQTPILLAIALAAAALFALHLTHRRIPRTTLRALADFALLAPILVWPWLF